MVVPVPGARVAAISADGRTVVGTAQNRAFAWRRGGVADDSGTFATGIEGDGTTEILSNPGAALGVSDDGSVIVGNGLKPARAERGGRRWVGTILAAPPPVGPRIGGAAVGVSGDGRVVVGTTVLNYEVTGRASAQHVEGYGEAAFVRDRPLRAKPVPTKDPATDEKPGDGSGEAVPSETEPPEAEAARIGSSSRRENRRSACSASSPTRAGGSRSGGARRRRRSRATARRSSGRSRGRGSRSAGPKGATCSRSGTFRGGRIETAPNAVSNDGAAIVGAAQSKNGTEAFRWSEADGIVGLGDLPGGRFRSVARAVSGDGTVVVGVATGTDGDEAFVWDAAHGMRPLGALVKVPSGWRLFEAVAVRPAPGGAWLVAGNGLDADGEAGAFLATVSLGG